MRYRANRETLLIERALHHVRKALPEEWQVIELPEDDLGEGAAVPEGELDAKLAIRPPRGKPFVFGLAVKSKIASGSKQLIGQLAGIHGRPLPMVVVAEYVPPSLRHACEDAGIGYIDTTGWMYLRDDRGLFLRGEGAERASVAPDRRRNEIGRLDGAGSSKVVRALWDARLPIGVRELAIIAAVSPGTVAKVLPSLERHGAVVRDDTGRIMQVDLGLLMQRWVQDYNFGRSNYEIAYYLSPRGLGRIHDRLDDAHLPLTLTGYQGARRYLPDSTVAVVPQTQFVAYVGDPDVLARDLTLLSASPQSANVVFVVPRDGSLVRKGVHVAPASQVIADLLTMGGRYPELGIQVFESVTDRAWRV